MTMDRSRRLELSLPGLFDELADARTPDYLEAAIELASSGTQRPAWTFPTRWLPMQVVATRVPTAPVPWRQLGVLALIALLLAAAVAVIVGSRTTRLPEPFGPAANGVIAMELNGDLYTVDPQTSEMTLLLGGLEHDEWSGFTPDGTRGVFVRWNGEPRASLARVGTISIAGETPPAFVEKDVLRGGEPIEVSPNGHEVAFSSLSFGGPYVGPDIEADEGFANNISVGDLGRKAFRTFAAPVADYGGIQFLAPDGRELVYLALSSDLHSHDIRALDVTSGESRPILETSAGNDIVGNVSAAPDGKHIAYAMQSATGAVTVHVVGTDGSGDRVVGHAPGATFEAWPQWDPQGRRLLIERDAGDGVVRPVVINLEGGPDVVIDAPISPNGAEKLWSPDGASILAQRTAADGRQLQQELWNARTGAVTPVDWPSVTPPYWQRIAAP